MNTSLLISAHSLLTNLNHMQLIVKEVSPAFFCLFIRLCVSCPKHIDTLCLIFFSGSLSYNTCYQCVLKLCFLIKQGQAKIVPLSELVLKIVFLDFLWWCELCYGWSDLISSELHNLNCVVQLLCRYVRRINRVTSGGNPKNKRLILTSEMEGRLVGQLDIL